MKIAICGSQPHSLARAPFQGAAYQQWQEGRVDKYPPLQFPGEDWEIWGCSPGLYSYAPRASRWFELHRWEPGASWFGAGYIEFLRSFRGPVYTGGTVADIPNHVVYPIDQVEEEFSSYFLTSSLALMFALAIMEIERVRATRKAMAAWPEDKPYPGPVLPPELARYLKEKDSDDAIGIWGVDMAATEEYGFQRPGCQFFILEAGRRGIGTYVPPESDLLRPLPVYGLSEWDHNYIKLTQRARQLGADGQQAAAEAEKNRNRLIAIQAEGAALDYFVKTWTSPYGMQPGLINRQVPGTGMGSGITQLDTRPIERMTVGALREAQVQAPPAAASEDPAPAPKPVPVALPRKEPGARRAHRAPGRNAGATRKR